jgi:serine protease Do
VDDKTIDDYSQLRNVIAAKAPGSKVMLTIIRDRKKMTLEVELGARPPKDELARRDFRDRAPGGTSAAGIEVADLSDDLVQRYGIERPVPGVVVVWVDPDGRAANSMLAEGDIIYRMNRQDITSVKDFQAVAARVGDNPLLLHVRRGQSNLFIVIPRK